MKFFLYYSVIFSKFLFVIYKNEAINKNKHFFVFYLKIFVVFL